MTKENITEMSIGIQTPGWPHDNFPNGITKYVGYVTKEMVALGISVTVLASRVEYSEQSNVRVLNVGALTADISLLDKFFRRLMPRSFINRQVLNTFKALVKTEEFRALHVIEMTDAFGRAKLLKKVTSTPIIVHLHGPWFIHGPILNIPTDRTYWNRIKVEGEAIASADGVTSPSLDVLEKVREYYKLPLAKAEVIPNPAPTIATEDCWSLDQCNKQTLLFVGRFDRHKGGDIVIDAFIKLKKKYTNLSLIFIGPDRGIENQNEKLVNINDFISAASKEKDVRESIRWMGQLSHQDITRYRKEALVTIVASRYENFGNVVLEAISHGCPLVASDSGGSPEIVKNGHTGLLFKSGDAFDLATKIEQLLEQPEYAKRLGVNALADSKKRFSALKLSRLRIEYYKKIISQKNI